jgi:hypothetical protein
MRGPQYSVRSTTKETKSAKRGFAEFSIRVIDILIDILIEN